MRQKDGADRRFFQNAGAAKRPCAAKPSLRGGLCRLGDDADMRANHAPPLWKAHPLGDDEDGPHAGLGRRSGRDPCRTRFESWLPWRRLPSSSSTLRARRWRSIPCRPSVSTCRPPGTACGCSLSGANPPSHNRRGYQGGRREGLTRKFGSRWGATGSPLPACGERVRVRGSHKETHPRGASKVWLDPRAKAVERAEPLAAPHPDPPRRPRDRRDKVALADGPRAAGRGRPCASPIGPGCFRH